MIKVDCGADALLSGFHFEFSEGGRWARSKCLRQRNEVSSVIMHYKVLHYTILQYTIV